MKLTMSVMIVVVLLCATVVQSAANNPAGTNRTPQPNIENPAGMGTVPPSSYSRPVKAKTDIYAGGGAGNLIVTGDVAGGRQFRGIVPYSSVNTFSGSTGRGTVDTFIKESQSVGYGSVPGAVQPYYTPSQTVSRMTPSGMEAVEPLQPATVKSRGQDILDLAREYRPLSRTPRELADVIMKQVPVSQTETSLLKAINDVRQKELLEQLDSVKQKADEVMEKSQKNASVTVQTPAEPASPPEVAKPATGSQKPKESESARPADVYDKMMQQLDKDLDDHLMSRQQTTGEAAVTVPGTERLSSIMQAGKNGKPLGLDELNAEGYKLHMGLAQEYMKQKKFYRAAETYALARAYKSQSAESFVGQGLALFATGEYMSSAYYIGLAIESEPNTAAKKIDLAAVMGEDKVTQRLADLQRWQQKTYSSEMEFLLAFVYYQTGKTMDAEDAIRAASVKMENYRPAAILREVILGKGR